MDRNALIIDNFNAFLTTQDKQKFSKDKRSE